MGVTAIRGSHLNGEFMRRRVSTSEELSQNRPGGEARRKWCEQDRLKGSIRAMILQSIALAILGVVAGVASGVVGIGGGIILVPALVFLFGLSQHQAQGTTLALLVPPIGILAAWAYWKQGLVDVRIASLICAGFLVGSVVGAKLSIGLSDQTLQRIFGITLLLIAIKMIFAKATL